MSWKAHLNTLHTKQLLAMRKSLYATGGKLWMDDNDQRGSTISLADIKEILNTRPHIPNKKEGKDIRRSNAMRGK